MESIFQDRLSLDLPPGLYDQIRATWVAHTRAVEARDLEAVLATVADDCVFEIMPMEQRWDGHDGAATFYKEMFEAFPDARMRMQDIVIGPQGVFQHAVMRGTSQGWWGNLPPTGRLIELKLIVFFPWNATAGKFAGERIWFA